MPGTARREIFVGNPFQDIFQRQRGGIFGKQFFADFKTVSRVVAPADFLQQRDLNLHGMISWRERVCRRPKMSLPPKLENPFCFVRQGFRADRATCD